MKEAARAVYLLLADVILVSMSFYIAYLIRFDGVIDMDAFRPYLRLWAYISLAHMIIGFFFKLYDPSFVRTGYKKRLFINVVNSSLVGGLAAMSINYAMRLSSGFMPSLVFVLACLLNVLFLYSFRVFIERQP